MTGTPELCHVPAVTQDLHLRRDELSFMQRKKKEGHNLWN
jgi:hypothetical protein